MDSYGEYYLVHWHFCGELSRTAGIRFLTEREFTSIFVEVGHGKVQFKDITDRWKIYDYLDDLENDYLTGRPLVGVKDLYMYPATLLGSYEIVIAKEANPF